MVSKVAEEVTFEVGGNDLLLAVYSGTRIDKSSYLEERVFNCAMTILVTVSTVSSFGSAERIL